MYFLDDFMKEFCICPECGSKLLLSGIDPVLADGNKDMELEICTLCSNKACETTWKFKFNISILEL